MQLRFTSWVSRYVAVAAVSATALLAADGAETSPATRPAGGIAVPEISAVAIDASNADWSVKDTQLGYRIDVIGEQGVRPPTDSNRAPSAQVAWTERGLAVLVTVHDTTPTESENTTALWERDSVELTVSNPDKPRQSYQYVVASGADPAQGKLRSALNDGRADKSPGKIAVEAAAQKTADGYVIEAMLPLDSLAMKAEIGSRVNFQVVVNDTVAAGQKVRYRWRPADAAPSAAPESQTLVLAPAGFKAPPFALTVSGEYQGMRRLRVRVNSALEKSQTLVVVDEDDKPLAPKLTFSGGRAKIDVPFPAEKPYGRLTVVRDGERVASFLPDKPPTRQSLLEQVKVRMSSFVFAGTQLPGVELDDALAAEDAAPDLAMTVQYFDAALNDVTSAKSPGRYAAVVRMESGGATDWRVITLYRVPGKAVDWRGSEVLLKGLKLPAETGIGDEVMAGQPRYMGGLFRDLIREDLRRNGSVAVALAGLAELPAGSPEVVARTDPWARDMEYTYALRKKLGLAKPYKYLEHLPPGYAEEKEKKFPLVVFLHGSGERGDDLQLVKKNGMPVYLGKHPEFPAIVIMPQCPRNSWWTPMALNDMLDEVMAKYRVDADRVVFTGLSMGGFGAWNYAAWHPERLAAIAPVCGIGDDRDMARLKNIPAWVFHGDADSTVPIGPDRACVEALTAAGGTVKFTAYPGVGHDSWTPAYATEELYTWILAQKRAAK